MFWVTLAGGINRRCIVTFEVLWVDACYAFRVLRVTDIIGVCNNPYKVSRVEAIICGIG